MTDSTLQSDETLLELLGSTEPVSPDYRMPENLKRMLGYEAEISDLRPYLDGQEQDLPTTKLNAASEETNEPGNAK